MSYSRAPILALTLTVTPGAFASGSAQDTKATTLSYRVDTALTYIDAARRPDTGSIAGPSPEALGVGQTVAAEQPRTLGLRYLKVITDWQTVEGASLHLLFRPDAVNHAEAGDAGVPVREFDGRSGSPYRPMPTVRLLDAYQLTIKPGTSLDLALGVFEDLLPRQAAYPEVFGFSLGVRLPAKFSAMRVRWQRRDQGPDTVAGKGGELHIDLNVMQGDEDRAEQQGANDNSFDRASVGQDPYYGGAAQVGWSPTRRLELNLLGGYGDGAVAGGRRNEVFAELAVVTLVALAERDLKLAMDLRMAREKWRGDDLDIEGRDQRSAELTGSVLTVPGLWYLLGFGYGQSERPKSEQVQNEKFAATGYQAETGFVSQIGKGLTLQFMVTHERQDGRDADGDQIGGFVAGDSNQATLRRIGLSLRYEGNG